MTTPCRLYSTLSLHIDNIHHYGYEKAPPELGWFRAPALMAFSRDQDLGNDDFDDDGAFSGVNFYREVLRDIYYSEELKVESKRSKQLASTIDRLCIAKPTIFFNLLEAVSKEIDVKKKELTGVNAKRRMHQASYMYQVERLPVVLRCLGKEEEGSMNDTILWQVFYQHASLYSRVLAMQIDCKRSSYSNRAIINLIKWSH